VRYRLHCDDSIYCEYGRWYQASFCTECGYGCTNSSLRFCRVCGCNTPEKFVSESVRMVSTAVWWMPWTWSDYELEVRNE